MEQNKKLIHRISSLLGKNRRIRLNEIIQFAVIGITVTLFINFVILSLRSNSLFCEINLFSDNIKKTLFKCHNTINTPTKEVRLQSSKNLICYFDDPFQDDFSLQKVNTNADLLLHSAKIKESSCYDAEALAAANAARRFRAAGNFKKAQQVIEHAFFLAPKHPDVLTEYGITLEMADNNIVEAEGFYRRALLQNPHHSEALIRQARVSSLVEDIDTKMLLEIYRKKDIFLKIPRNNSGLKRAMRESYIQHIYHTVALEGNTMTLMQTRSILETKLAVAGKSIIEHNEILGMEAALRYLNRSLTNIGEITLEHILDIHKRVLGYVDPLAAGVIRNTQVYVGGFTPPAPENIPAAMNEFIAWLNDEDTLAIDPVELAALAHYRLVFIHPFVDGNGRTSRLLMNYILMQAGFPPVIIKVSDRLRYYSVLKSANEVDIHPFIRFIAEGIDRTLESFITSASMVCDICTSTLESNENNNLNIKNKKNEKMDAENSSPNIIMLS